MASVASRRPWELPTPRGVALWARPTYAEIKAMERTCPTFGSSVQLPPRLQVPDFQRLVLRCGDDPPPVRRHHTGRDRSSVADKCCQLLSRLEVPHPERPII